MPTWLSGIGASGSLAVVMANCVPLSSQVDGFRVIGLAPHVERIL